MWQWLVLRMTLMLLPGLSVAGLCSNRWVKATFSPDDQRLVQVALRGEGDDVVAALELCKRVAGRVPPQLHGAPPLLAVHNAWRDGPAVVSMNVNNKAISRPPAWRPAAPGQFTTPRNRQAGVRRRWHQALCAHELRTPTLSSAMLQCLSSSHSMLGGDAV